MLIIWRGKEGIACVRFVNLVLSDLTRNPKRINNLESGVLRARLKIAGVSYLRWCLFSYRYWWCWINNARSNCQPLLCHALCEVPTCCRVSSVSTLTSFLCEPYYRSRKRSLDGGRPGKAKYPSWRSGARWRTQKRTYPGELRCEEEGPNSRDIDPLTRHTH